MQESILFSAAFMGGYPIAATDLNFAEAVSKKISKSSIQEEKNNGTDTYIYDENLGYG